MSMTWQSQYSHIFYKWKRETNNKNNIHNETYGRHINYYGWIIILHVWCSRHLANSVTFVVIRKERSLDIHMSSFLHKEILDDLLPADYWHLATYHQSVIYHTRHWSTFRWHGVYRQQSSQTRAWGLEKGCEKNLGFKKPKKPQKSKI